MSSAIDEPARVGFVVSQYPTMSHAFITREIRSLESLGWTVDLFSVRNPVGNGRVAPGDDSPPTTTLLGQPTLRFLQAQLWLIALCPRAWAHGLRQAVGGLRGRSPKDQGLRLAYFAEAVLLLRLVRQRRLGHLHVHFANGAAEVVRLATDMSCRQRRRRPVSFSVTLHSLAMHGQDGTASADWPSRNAGAWGDVAEKVAAADFTVCISEFVRRELLKLPHVEAHAAKLIVIHMGIDLTHFQFREPSPVGEVLRAVFVGRLAPEKRPGDLVQAVSVLRAEGVAAHLDLVGRGPLEDDLREQIRTLGLENDVRLCGARSQAELPGVYRGADVLVLPSLVEGVPVVLMEAMACGTPVVTTPVAGTPELVSDGLTGMLVPVGDTVGLARQLMALFSGAVATEDLARRARAHVETEFDSRKCARLLSDRLHVSLRGHPRTTSPL